MISEFLPVINTCDQLSTVYAETVETIINGPAQNQVFQNNGHMVYLRNADGKISIEKMTEKLLFAILVHSAMWVRVNTKGEPIPSKPPREIIPMILEIQSRTLPELNSIMTTPFVTDNGNVITTPGYDEDSKSFFSPDPELEGLSLPGRISPLDIRDARRLILNELFIDFPFQSESDRAHGIAALVLPFVRRMVDGPTPLHCIEASTPRTGKSLLSDLISIISTGHECDGMTLPSGEDSIRRQLISVMGKGERSSGLKILPRIEHCRVGHCRPF